MVMIVAVIQIDGNDEDHDSGSSVGGSHDGEDHGDIGSADSGGYGDDGGIAGGGDEGQE